MAGPFQSSPRPRSSGNPGKTRPPVRALEELIEILSNDPHKRNGRYPIKKLAGLKLGEGQRRARWRDYRPRYDIFGSEVVLHSFRHRKEAY